MRNEAFAEVDETFLKKIFLCFSHHRVHTGEKIFECPHCPGKRFAQSYGRTLHMKSHHQNLLKSSETCKICGIEMTTKANLKAHLVKVHDVVENLEN